jgi:hypothetical protein
LLNKLKNIFSGQENREEPPAELPEVSPFKDIEEEQAPAPAHKPDHIKADINHAGHMRIVAKSEEEAARLGAEALKLARDKKTVKYGEDTVSAYLSDFRHLKFITIARNGDTLCTFPFFNAGKPVDARITEITECRNGCEGQLEIYTKGSALTFFDALYFKNKNTYFPGKDARVLLSGIAYVLTRMKGVPAEDKKGGKAQKNGARDRAHDQELAFRHENGDVDDYVFRGRVKGAREFDVLGIKAQVIEVPLRIGADSVIDIYVCVTENAIKEKINKGDYVSGIMWLQGFVL